VRAATKRGDKSSRTRRSSRRRRDHPSARKTPPREHVRRCMPLEGPSSRIDSCLVGRLQNTLHREAIVVSLCQPAHPPATVAAKPSWRPVAGLLALGLLACVAICHAHGFLSSDDFELPKELVLEVVALVAAALALRHATRLSVTRTEACLLGYVVLGGLSAIG